MNDLERQKKVKKIFLLLNFLFEFYAGITGATMILFLYAQNLDTMQANIVVATTLIVTFIFEIPAGALSDYLGYVKIAVLSGILLCVTNFLFLFGQSMEVFLIAQVCLGISAALESGTLDAWVIENTSEAESNTIFAKKNKWISIVMLSAGFIGGVLADIELRLMFVLAFVAAVLFTVVSSVYMKKLEKPRNRTRVKEEKNSLNVTLNNLKNVIRCSMKYCVQDKGIRNVILYNSILAFCFSPVFVFWSPVLYEYGEKHYALIGGVWVLMRIFTLAGNMILERIRNKSISRLAIVTMCCGMVVFIMAFQKQFFSILIGILLFEVLLGMIYPLRETVLNVLISNDNRATILSFNSMIVCIFNYVSMIIMGGVATYLSISSTWMMSGVMLIILGLFTIRIDFNSGENDFD